MIAFRDINLKPYRESEAQPIQRPRSRTSAFGALFPQTPQVQPEVSVEAHTGRDREWVVVGIIVGGIN